MNVQEARAVSCSTVPWWSSNGICPAGIYADLPVSRGTQCPHEGSSQKWMESMNRTSFPWSAFPSLTAFITAWGIQGTNLVCRIVGCQETDNPCCYWVFPARAPLQVLQNTPLHIRELSGALAPGTPLKLKITLLTPEAQRWVLVMAMPPDYMNGCITGEHEIPEDSHQGTPDLGRLEMQRASSLGNASS